MEDWLLFVNDNNLNLQFTGFMDSKSIEFLDVTPMGEEDRVVSKLYRKPSASNSLLRADSGHPRHTIKSIPVGQF